MYRYLYFFVASLPLQFLPLPEQIVSSIGIYSSRFEISFSCQPISKHILISRLTKAPHPTYFKDKWTIIRRFSLSVGQLVP